MRTRTVIWHSQSDAHAAHGYALPTTGEIKKFGLARGVSSKKRMGCQALGPWQRGGRVLPLMALRPTREIGTPGVWPCA